MSLDLDMWVFVRIMVALEERDPSPDAAALFRVWAQEWAEVDQHLSDLSKLDFPAYSDMMMNSQITLKLPCAHAATFRGIVQDLIETLSAKRAASTDPEFRKDLNFEIEGLRALG